MVKYVAVPQPPQSSNLKPQRQMTESEYELQLNQWAANAKKMMASILSSGTHGTGYSPKNIKVQVRDNRKTGGHWIGFKFPKYGVFVHYGVGRGWVRQGNAVVRGSRVKKNSEIWHQMKKRGYSTKELSKASIPIASKKPGMGRKPLDWFDKVLKAHINELADVAAEFYGDDSREKLGEMLERMTIKKGKQET